MEPYIIPLGALIVSVATLIMTGMGMRSKAGLDEVDRRTKARDAEMELLRAQIAKCETERTQFQEVIEQYKLALSVCTDDRLDLTRRLLRALDDEDAKT